MAPAPSEDPGPEGDGGTADESDRDGGGGDESDTMTDPGTLIDPEETIDLLQELVRIPSPYFEEDEVATFVFEWLADHGLDPRYHHVSEPAVTGFEGDNVIARLDGADLDAPCLLLNAHMDTVQIVDGWDEDPVSGRIEDGRLYGQGACDMKGGLAAAMVALAALAAIEDETPGSLRGDVLFTAVVDEEGPYSLGTDRLIRDGYLDDCDMAIVPEPGPLLAQTPVEHPALMIGARGRVLVEILVEGSPAHGSKPDEGRNAVVVASKIATAIEEMPIGSHPELGAGSVCPLLLEGGSETLSVPDRARLLVDRHIVVGETADQVLQEVRDLVDSLDLDAAVSVGLRDAPEPDMGYGPYVTDPDHPLLDALSSASRATTGRDPDIGYFSSVGDFNLLGHRLGLPTAIVGPDGGNIHGTGEYVDTADVVDVARILARGIDQLLR